MINFNLSKIPTRSSQPRNSHEVREGLIDEILTKIPAEKIIWETPEKEQQLFLLN